MVVRKSQWVRKPPERWSYGRLGGSSGAVSVETVGGGQRNQAVTTKFWAMTGWVSQKIGEIMQWEEEDIE